jgi:hypothetical protein
VRIVDGYVLELALFTVLQLPPCNVFPCISSHWKVPRPVAILVQLLCQDSQALAGMDLDSFVPRSAVEAMASDLRTAEDAGLSRLLPIQDGPDQWEICRSSSGKGSGGPDAHLSSDNVQT